MLSTNGLSVEYAGVPVLKNVSMTLHAREIVGVHAPSGSGKSTLAAALTGLLPASARATAAPNTKLPAAGGHICLMSQNAQHALNPSRSIGDWLRRIQPLRRFESLHQLAARLFEESEWTGVENSLPHELSGGMRQRALLLGLLFRGPEILVCDEPVSAQDDANAARMVSALEAFADDQRAVVWLSHEPAEGIAHRHYRLRYGELQDA